MALAHAAPSRFADDLVALLGSAAGRSGRTRQGGGGQASARAFGLAGLAALVSLPPLIALSVGLKAPLAAPSAIALGYFGAAAALAAGDRDRAGAWSAGVLVALVGWTALSVLGASRGGSGLPTVGALLAPLFAAAPAFAPLRRPLQADTARAARPRRTFDDEPVSALAGTGQGAPHAQGDLRRRLQKPVAQTPTIDPTGAWRARAAVPASTDLVAALRFAIGASSQNPGSTKAPMRLDLPPACRVRCDERSARRIAAAALELAGRAEGRGRLDIAVRPVKGAVLLRIVGENLSDDPRDGEAALRRLQALADAAGGSAVAVNRGGQAEISIRLAPAAQSPDASVHAEGTVRVEVGARHARA